jgi:hypothetical protein
MDVGTQDTIVSQLVLITVKQMCHVLRKINPFCSQRRRPIIKDISGLGKGKVGKLFLCSTN